MLSPREAESACDCDWLQGQWGVLSYTAWPAFLWLKIAVSFDTSTTYLLTVSPVFQSTKILRHRRTCEASDSFLSGYFNKGKSKFVALYVTKAQEGNGVTEIFILNLGARWTSVEPPEKGTASAPEPFCNFLKKIRLSCRVTNLGPSGSLSSECTDHASMAHIKASNIFTNYDTNAFRDTTNIYYTLYCDHMFRPNSAMFRPLIWTSGH